MDANLLNFINAFTDRKILVIGEAMLDSYLEGDSERLCREAPVPVIAIRNHTHVPGGAANTAVNIRSLGGEVHFLSVTGDDEEGGTLRHALEERGVSAEHVQSFSNRRTLWKQRIIAASQMLVRFDQGSTHDLDAKAEQFFIQKLSSLFPQSDAIIISDYGYGIMTPGVIKAIETLQRKDPRLIVVDSKQPLAYQNIKVTAMKPNYEEAVKLLGLEKATQDADRIHQIETHGQKILELTGAQVAAITLDRNGALVFSRGEPAPYRTYAQPMPNSRAAGAGDTFVSMLTLCLASGAPVENAAELASAAASVVVAKDGTAACTTGELRDMFSASDKYINNVFQLAARAASYRRAGRKVVFTNGCFDILHRGHIAYLNRAKALGEVLIVALNSDDSVRRLKGPDRPINTLDDRISVISELSCVDHIVSFSSDTPEELIKIIRPDIFVKGGDYSRLTLPEAALVEELGGKMEIMPYLENHSTTDIIEKIRNSYTLITPDPLVAGED